MRLLTPSTSSLVCGLAAVGLTATSARALDIATLAPGGAFTFGDFGVEGALVQTGGVFDIDIMVDDDGSNGLFGGLGQDVTAAFDASIAQLEVSLTVDPLNAASSFNVILSESDNAFEGDEFQFGFDISGVTPGVPTVLTQQLLIPGPIFTQAQFDKDPGDGIQNYDPGPDAGLQQIQIQSVFGGTDRLKIMVDSVKIVDPEDPTIFSFTPETQQGVGNSFDFGTFAGAVDTTNGNFVINAVNTGDPSPANGGIGFNGTNLDFDAENAKLIVEAKLLPGNTATGFDIIMNDLDGDDSGPGLGSDEYFFRFDTADFNETDFATVEIQLGTGSEEGFRNTFGFTNGGDGLQNFDLAGMQIQSLQEDATLAIEIISATIVESILAGIEGDYDNGGQVEQTDLDFVLSNWGDTDVSDVTNWVNFPGGGAFDGLVDQNELDGVLLNWGSTSAPDFAGSSVPEPASLAVLAGLGVIALRRRRA